MTIKGKFLPDNPSEGYNQVGNESHSSLKGKYAGAPTKGNRDLPTNRTAGVKSGVGDPRGAGGKG